MILSAVNFGYWSPIRLVSGGTPLSHCFFADDLVLFGEASLNQANIIIDTLEHFFGASGQSINKGKSKVFFSKNTPRILSREITNCLGIEATQDLGRYLGAPILHGRVTKQSYAFLLDRLDKRLAGWKGENLSLAGRVTLASSVLNSLPCYIMQTALLPVSLCDKIDRKIRNFIWGSSEGNRKIHNVNWETVCKPKCEGGLGLRNARDGIHWNIGNGRNTLFWTDRWIDSGAVLIDHAINIQEVDSSLSVSDFCNNNCWDLQKLRSVLPEAFVLQVYGMSPPRADGGTDCRAWGLEGDGVFSVKSAYGMLREIKGGDNGNNWSKIWKWEGPNKIRHFMWLLQHDKLMTNVERGRRRLTDNLICQHCNGGEEDLNHVFRECCFASQTWNRILPHVVLGEQRTMEFKEWWIHGISDPVNSSIFGFTLWLLWSRRNKLIFEDNALSVDEIANQVSFWVQFASSCWKTRRLGREAPGFARQTQLIGWRPGGEGCFTLNTDGSLHRVSNSSVAGGIIRDDQGRFVSAFASKLGVCSIVRAEIWAVVEGMVLAWNCGIRKLRVQSDSAIAVRLLSGSHQASHKYSNLIRNFQELLSRQWEVTIEHIYHEANFAADYLANSGHDLDLGTVIFSSPCNGLMDWLHYDLLGVSIPRSFNNIL
ncbi:Putative ribonuclease H protein At1g65750 [Linum perenne]